MKKRTTPERAKEPPFKAGEEVEASFYNRKTTTMVPVIIPCIIIEVKELSSFLSGWGVRVQTKSGQKWLDSGFFSKKPAW